jgi:hypothetical protein
MLRDEPRDMDILSLPQLAFSLPKVEKLYRNRRKKPILIFFYCVNARAYRLRRLPYQGSGLASVLLRKTICDTIRIC